MLGNHCEMCENGYQRQTLDGTNRYETCRECNCNRRELADKDICDESSGMHNQYVLSVIYWH